VRPRESDPQVYFSRWGVPAGSMRRGTDPRGPILPLRVRPARATDLDGIRACLGTAFAPYRRQYTPAAWAATVLTSARLARRMRTMTVLVAVERGGRIVGTLSVKRIAPRHAHLRGMAVVPDRQGTGVATRLLGAALRDLHDRRGGTVTLETTAPLARAARFYARGGFVRTGSTRTWGGMRLTEWERPVGPARRPRSARAGAPRGRPSVRGGPRTRESRVGGRRPDRRDV